MTYADPNAHAPGHMGPFDPANPVAEAEEAAYLTLCTCDDTLRRQPVVSGLHLRGAVVVTTRDMTARGHALQPADKSDSGDAS